MLVQDPIKVDLGQGLQLYSVPPPGSGVILAYILNIMKHYNVTSIDRNDPLMYHRLVEAFKYGYAFRSQIGDPADANITKVVNQVMCALSVSAKFLSSHQRPFPQIVEKLTSEKAALETFRLINDSRTSQDPRYYGGDFQLNDDHGTSHTSVLAANGDAVAVTSTVNLQ